MKRFSRRVTALLLALTMVFALAATAFAGTYTWSDTSGTHKMTVTTTSTKTTSHTFSNATEVVHVQGTSGDTTTARYSQTVTVRGTHNCPNTYSVYMEKAMQKDGMYLGQSKSVSSGQYAIVPANAKTGHYQLGFNATRKSGTWKVTDVEGSTNSLAMAEPMAISSGTFTNAVASLSGLTVIYVGG